jgi:hAT family C-terminal dimerisation region
MALDFLPIQASAVPSEQVFSSSAETDTKKRNCINPVLMEALQMLKFTLKKARLNFTDGWITPEMVMWEWEPEEDSLSAFLRANGEDVLD